MKKFLLICIMAVAFLAPVAAQAQRAATVFVGPRFGWGWYGPFWDSYPYGLYDGYYHAPVTGTVKFDTSSKDAQVFINGAYAGTVGKLKTMHLQPGSYEIELRTSGRTQYAEKVYVVAGKTLHLNPDLLVQARP
jgi:hypothetical protein